MDEKKPWGGRFRRSTDQRVESFTQSVDFDQRLYAHDIRGSIAHARMLAHVGVLSDAEADAIVAGLSQIRGDIEEEVFEWSSALEDVHMNIEHQLIKRIGDVGKKLHTARSRNDQIATDLRLYLRDAVDDTVKAIQSLQDVLLGLAERELSTLMPGFTHLQAAQPVTLGHHIMAWVEMLERDLQRLTETRRRINIMPLGCAALAGTGIPIDREFTARELGFDSLSTNSLDAVSDRDFASEFIAVGALLMIHLSRVAEELILWSSEQFGFVDLGDAFCTGSSIMPQKKNPDVAELTRGKTGRVVGHLMATLMLMKAQPLAYNRDNQEDKQPLFDTVDTVLACLEIMEAMLAQVRFDRRRMRAAAQQGHSTATDLAEYLVTKGVPFRDAHEAVGAAVRYAVDHDMALTDMSLEDLQRFHPAVAEDVLARLTVEGSVKARAHIGGTAPQQVMQAIQSARERLERNRQLTHYVAQGDPRGTTQVG